MRRRAGTSTSRIRERLEKDLERSQQVPVPRTCEVSQLWRQEEQHDEIGSEHTLTYINSDTLPLRRRIWQAGLRKGKCTKVVHVRKVEGQGRCHEGYQDGTNPQEGPDQGEVVKCWNCTTPTCTHNLEYINTLFLTCFLSQREACIASCCLLWTNLKHPVLSWLSANPAEDWSWKC